jgi:hypothetical protein
VTTQKQQRQLMTDATSLLHALVGLYEQALALEEKLAGAIGAADHAAIRHNTRDKNQLMARIEETDRQLAPFLDIIRPKDGVIGDAGAEALRLKAVDLLQRILEKQRANVEALQGRRGEMMSGMQNARAARQVARGYKPSPSLYHSSLDTKS